MTRLLLHVGAPKTGTTAIQGYLARHEEKLRDLGVNYTRTQRPHIAHNTLPRLFGKGHGAEYIRALSEEIAESSAKVHVISSEMLFRLPVAKRTALQFAKHLPGELRPGVRVVCYLRRHDRFIEALYKQFVKNGKIEPDPQAFAAGQMQTLSFADVLRAYGDAFGPENVIARPFERGAFPGGDVVRDFSGLLGVAGLEDLETVSPDQTNPTLSCEISEVLGQVRRHTPFNNRQMIRDITAMNLPDAFAGNDVFDHKTHLRLIDYFDADDTALCAWSGRETGTFFDRSDLETPPPAPRTSEEIAERWRTATEIVIRALSRQIPPG